MAENILKHPQFDQIASALEADRGLPAGTLRAVAMQESGGNPNAVSPKGAQGAYQFIPATAKAYNVDVTNPWDSLRGAADYLGDNMKKYGKIEAALADYNGGPSQAQAVLKQGAPNYQETQNYVSRIMKNIGNAIVPSAQAAESAPQPQQAAPTARTGVIDPKLIQQAGYKIAKAKINGISDNDIVSGLVQTAPPAIADVVKKNLAAGVSPADIVKGVGGAPLADWQKQKDYKVTDDMTGYEKFMAGVGKSFADTGTGVKQLWTRATGTDADVKKLQADVAETQQRDAALMDTGAGKVGYAAGVIAPTVATMGAGGVANAAARAPMLARAVQVANSANKLPGVARALSGAEMVMAPKTIPQMGVAGVAQGLVTPTATDEQGQLMPVIGGAAGMGVGYVLNKALGAIARPLGREVAESAPEMINTADKLGLPLSTGNIVKATDPGSWRGKLVGKYFNPSAAQIEATNEAIANQVGKGVGIEGARVLDSELVNSSNPYARFDQLTQGTRIPVSRARLAADIGPALQQYGREAGVPNASLLNEVNSYIRKAAPVNGVNPAYTAQELQRWRSNLGAMLPNANSSEQALINATRDAIESRMTTGLTAEQKAAFDAANKQWRNQLALEQMVKKSNDSGVVTPLQMLQSSKQIGARDFARGNAPYQELATALNRLYGKGGVVARPAANSLTLSDLVGGSVVGGIHGMVPAAAYVAGKHLAGKGAQVLLNSTKSGVRNALTGNTATQRAIAQAAVNSKVLVPALARYLASQAQQ